MASSVWCVLQILFVIRICSVPVYRAHRSAGIGFRQDCHGLGKWEGRHHRL